MSRESARPDGDRIRSLRRRLKWTQEDLGKKAGWSERTIQDAEGGHRNLKVETLTHIAEALGVELASIVKEDTLTPGMAKPELAEKLPGERMDAILELHHVNLPVRDLAASMHFYGDLLRLRHMGSERPPFGFPGEWYELPNGQQIHLILYDEGTYRQERKIHFKDVHFALRVRDWDAAWSFLQNQPDMQIIPGPLAMQCYISDPDGHIIEITGMMNSRCS